MSYDNRPVVQCMLGARDTGNIYPGQRGSLFIRNYTPKGWMAVTSSIRFQIIVISRKYYYCFTLEFICTSVTNNQIIIPSFS